MKHSQYGYSTFVLFMDEDKHPLFLAECEKWKEFSDVVREYKILGKEKAYYFIQLEFMDYHRSGEEICRFIFTHFPFIAIHQEESTYILAKNGEEFRAGVRDAYKTKDNSKYFFYDMLTMTERYVACMHVEPSLKEKTELQYTFDLDGCHYRLNLDKDSPFMFKEDSEIDIIDCFTNETISVDILDGMDIFTFKIAILSKKS